MEKFTLCLQLTASHHFLRLKAATDFPMTQFLALVFQFTFRQGRRVPCFVYVVVVVWVAVFVDFIRPSLYWHLDFYQYQLIVIVRSAEGLSHCLEIWTVLLEHLAPQGMPQVAQQYRVRHKPCHADLFFFFSCP